MVLKANSFERLPYVVRRSPMTSNTSSEYAVRNFDNFQINQTDLLLHTTFIQDAHHIRRFSRNDFASIKRSRSLTLV